jgi:hypothetical protein
MRGRIVMGVLVLAACQSGSPSAPVASPSPTATSAGGAQAPTQGTLRDARALTRGGPSAMTLGCRVHAYAGPFRLERSGQSVRIASAARSVSGAQACGVQLTWVDAQDQPVGTAGIGCPEGAATATAENVYEYSPDNGGSSANPVYLRIVREDPEGCPPVGLTLTLQ